MPVRCLLRRLVAAAFAATFLAALPADAQRRAAADRAALLARIDSIVGAAMQIRTAGIQVAAVKGRDTLVPKAPTHWHRVTIRQLLNHTSGIPSMTDVGPKSRAPLTMGMRRDSIFEQLLNDSLMFEPGQGFDYNNTGYILLGMLVEQLAAKPYGVYISEMLKPLGVAQTTYCGGPQIVKHRAQGYDRVGAGLVNASAIAMDVPFSAGSMCSTARDMVQWASALASGRVVKPASYALITSPVTNAASFPMTYAASFPMTYGFALTVDSMVSRRTVHHGGDINGFSSNLLHVSGDSLFVAVNMNVSGAPAVGIGPDIARAVIGVPRVTAAQRDEPITAAERARFAGRYSVGQPNGTRVVFIVGEAEDHLTLQAPCMQQPLVLHRQGGNAFIVRGQPAQRVVFATRGDRVTAIMLDRGVRPLLGSRVE